MQTLLANNMYGRQYSVKTHLSSLSGLCPVVLCESGSCSCCCGSLLVCMLPGCSCCGLLLKPLKGSLLSLLLLQGPHTFLQIGLSSKLQRPEQACYDEAHISLQAPGF